MNRQRMLGLFFCAVCAPTAMAQDNYAASIASIPKPTSEADFQQKCAWLRGEMVRQQNIASIAAGMAPMYAAIAQMKARNNIAVLEARASDFECRSAFSNGPSPAPVAPPKPAIEACVATCKANTSRTPEQCFDACNH